MVEKLFLFLRTLAAQDIPAFLGWYLDPSTPVGAIEQEDLPADEHLRAALRTVVGYGEVALEEVDFSDLSEIQAAVAGVLAPPIPSPRVKPWEKVTTGLVPTPATPSLRPIDEDLQSEDLRNWDEASLKEEVVDLLDAAYRKHQLTFSVASEESVEQVENLLNMILTSDAPMTREALGRKVDARYARIKENRTAGDAVRAALNGTKVPEEVFGALIRIKRSAAQTLPFEAVCAAASALCGAGHTAPEVIQVLERGIALGDLDRSCRRMLGCPLPVGAVQQDRIAPKPAPVKATRAWDRK